MRIQHRPSNSFFSLLLLLSTEVLLIWSSCRMPENDISSAKEMIIQTEKDFEQMALTQGLSAAFYHFADTSAVINRNDSLIQGRDAIRQYLPEYDSSFTLNWKPDFVHVSQSGDLAYTYGHYVFSRKDSTGIQNRQGIFHTVWKKQADGSWRFVWD